MFRSTLLPLYVTLLPSRRIIADSDVSLVAYNKLVMFSFGFQHAFQRGIGPSDHIFFTKVR